MFAGTARVFGVTAFWQRPGSAAVSISAAITNATWFLLLITCAP
jgi:hypothetical protein